jgi:hypothetical protein
MDLDPERFRLQTASKGDRKAARSSPRRQGDKRFLKGPIPLAWLIAAARLPGKPLAVAVALWFLAGCRKEFVIPLTRSILAEFNVSRNAGYRGLHRLEQAGLVQVDRRRGRCPRVTILAPHP